MKENVQLHLKPISHINFLVVNNLVMIHFMTSID